MANRRYIDFPIASTSGDTDIILIWQGGANKQTTKATFLSGLPENLDELNDVAIAGLTNGQILRYDSVTGKWENTDQGNLDLNDLNDVSIVSPSNGQVLVYNSSTSRWENSSGGYVPYTGAVTTVNLGAQTIQAGSFVKAGGTAAQFLKANGSIDSTVYGTGSVTSVALTMPTAFSVANSPVTTAGTLAVTGAGTVGQYIRGDGSLADFPESSGGGSSVSYYLNGSVNQGTIGGVAYKELNKVPILGAGTDFTINADGYIASFITDAGDPNLLEIPAGNWTFETYFSASSGGGSPSFYVELYKVNSGGTATLIASNSTFPELIAFGTNIISYFSTLAVPTTALALTDRLAIRYYVTHSGRTITLHTEDNHLCQIITTFTTGLTALNGLTAQIQNFAVGTSGTDFAIASATATHTFNLPTASAANRGALSSADWTTFNNKTSNLGTVTSVGLSSATSGVTIGSSPVTTSGTITLAIATASGSQNGLLSSTDWTTFNSKQNALTNPVTGTGTSGQVAYFTGTTAISSESNLFWDATNDRLGIGNNTPATTLDVNGVGLFTGASLAGNTKNGVYIFDSVITSLAGGSARALQIQALTLSFFTGATYTEKLKVFENGNVVISTSPSDNGARLQVSGTATALALDIISSSGVGSSSASGLARFITAGTSTGVSVGQSNSARKLDLGSQFIRVTGDDFFIVNASANATVFENNGGESMRITSGRNVGIGTASPSSRLSVQWDKSALFAGAAIYDSQAFNASNHGGTVAFGGTFNSGGSYTEWSAIGGMKSNTTDGNVSGDINFYTRLNSSAMTEQMRITSGGNVLIGTTTDNGVGRLQVSGGSITVAGGVRFSSSGADANRWSVYWNGGTGDLIVVNNISDIRAKKDFDYNIKGLETITKLKPLKFTWKDGTSHSTSVSGRLRQYGFIAQETMQADDFLAWHNESHDTWGIEQYESFTAVIVKAIQELKQEIDTLKN